MKKILSFLFLFLPFFLSSQINEKPLIELEIVDCVTDAAKNNISIKDNTKGVFPVRIDLYECLTDAQIEIFLYRKIENYYQLKGRQEARGMFSQIIAETYLAEFDNFSDSTYLDLQRAKFLSSLQGTWKYSKNGNNYNTLIVSNDTIQTANQSFIGVITKIESNNSVQVTLQGGTVLEFRKQSGSFFIAINATDIYFWQKISS